MKKFCIVCGSENFSRSKNFCCEKCHQQYYYQKNREKLLEKHNKHYSENKEQYISNNYKRYLENKEKTREYLAKWQNENREHYRELARLSYARRKEALKGNE